MANAKFTGSVSDLVLLNFPVFPLQHPNHELADLLGFMRYGKRCERMKIEISGILRIIKSSRPRIYDFR
jgi:hypothetical protein